MKWKVNDGCTVRFSRNARPAVIYEAGAIFEADRHEITGLEPCLTAIIEPVVKQDLTTTMETMIAERAPETLDKPKKRKK